MNPEDEVIEEEQSAASSVDTPAMNATDAALEEEQPAAPPIYTCETVLNVEIQEEASLALAPKYMKYVNYLCYGLCAVMLGFLLWSYFAVGGTGNLLLAALVLAVLAFLIYSHITGPKKMLRQWQDNMIRTYGTDELHLTTEFYKYSVAQTLRENNDILVDSYTDLLSFTETENLFLLKKGKGRYFFVAKNGLKKTTADEFRTFISERIGGK